MKESKRKAATVCLYALFAAIVVLCGILGKDKWYNVVCSVVAIVYLLLLTDGISYGFLLCSVYAAGYAVISFGAGFYATSAFHALVLLPTSVYRFIAALQKKKNAKNVRALSGRGWAISLFVCFAFAAVLYFLLKFIEDAQPLLDGTILAISLLTSFMMLKNYREMWAFNLAGSVLYVVMWTAEFVASGTGLAFAAVQAVVTVINVKGIIADKKRSACGENFGNGLE